LTGLLEHQRPDELHQALGVLPLELSRQMELCHLAGLQWNGYAMSDGEDGSGGWADSSAGFVRGRVAVVSFPLLMTGRRVAFGFQFGLRGSSVCLNRLAEA